MRRRDLLRRMPAVPFVAAEWFANGLRWLIRPQLQMPAPGAAIDSASVRAVIQWERFWEQVEQNAQSYNVPIEDARRIASEFVNTPVGS